MRERGTVPNVDRAVQREHRRHVLAPGGAIAFGQVHQAVGALLDQVEVRVVRRLADAHHQLRIGMREQRRGNVAALAQRRSRLQVDHAADQLALTLEVRDEVLDHRQLAGLVGRERSRPQVRHMGACRARNVGDTRVICRDIDGIDLRTTECMGNGVRDERLAREHADVLARQALAAAARADRGDRASCCSGRVHDLRKRLSTFRPVSALRSGWNWQP
jgi:hypothetical protein